MKKSVVFVGVLMAATSFGQATKEDAHKMVNEAVEMMDNGKPDEAIELLEKAKKIEPDSYRYDYEIAYAYYIKKDVKKALKIYEAVVKYKDVTDRGYQMLGNMYDIAGDPGAALKAYAKGLRKFPYSGRLYLETGNVFFNQKKYAEALPYYEKGIQVEPMYSSNYYRATLIYCNSEEVVWGLIYGELFMNIERNSKRTGEISKLLFDSYRNHISFSAGGDTAVTTFSKSNVISVQDVKDQKLPYASLIFESTFLASIAGEKEITMHTLDHIRREFPANYVSMGFSGKYPNVLIDYQSKILKAGHMEAYNYWILMKGDEDTFSQWRNGNKQKWEVFLTWFGENKLELTDHYKFYREQY